MASVIDFVEYYARKTGVRARVKTNLGPAFTVYDASDTSAPGLLARLVKARVSIEDDSGRVLFEVGEPAPTDPVLVGALLAVVGVVGFVFARGVLTITR